MTGSLRILLLDDEPLILLDLEFAAELAGCVPLTACCCEEALDLVTRENVDVAVLDVSLGAGDTCAPVAAQLAERNIPFVLYTGDPRHLAEDIRALCRHMLVKPVPAELVVRTAVAAIA